MLALTTQFQSERRPNTSNIEKSALCKLRLKYLMIKTRFWSLDPFQGNPRTTMQNILQRLNRNYITQIGLIYIFSDTTLLLIKYCIILYNTIFDILLIAELCYILRYYLSVFHFILSNIPYYIKLYYIIIYVLLHYILYFSSIIIPY